MIEFIMGSFWLLAFIVLFFGVGIWSSEKEDALIATLTLVAILLGLEFILGYNVFSAIWSNPLLFLVAIVGYIVIGFMWAIYWKYPKFLTRREESIRRKYTYFRTQRSGDPIPDTPENVEAFMKSDYYYDFSPLGIKPRIYAWVCMWPWSTSWAILNEPFIWIYNQIHRIVADTLDRVGKSVTRKVLK